MLLSVYTKLMTDNYTGTVTVELASVDTAVYVQAAYVSHQLDRILLIKQENQYINCHSMLTNKVSIVVIPLH